LYFNIKIIFEIFLNKYIPKLFDFLFLKKKKKKKNIYIYIYIFTKLFYYL